MTVFSVSGHEAKEEDMKLFDPATPPPFSIGDIRAAIPPHCWVKNPWRSFYYVVRDIAAVFGLLVVAVYLDSWVFWPVYWVAQGTMFWALFVLGHDCGHGSFSDNTTLNNVVGHLLHSSILVPYHGWRISHRTHHQNHGHVEQDESWVPLPETLYKHLSPSTKFMRYKLPFPMFAYPFYLWFRSPGKTGSHYNPNSPLFKPYEKTLITTSTACWSLVLAFLVSTTFIVGPLSILKLYIVPYFIFVVWLDSVTYLHHHGYYDEKKKKLPWYRGEEWSYLRGGLTTVDRDYGMFNGVHHDIGTHVVHHLFPQIPHYRLVEVTREAKKVLGEYYREPRKSRVVPFHLVGSLVKSIRSDHYVSDSGDVVFYQTDEKMFD